MPWMLGGPGDTDNQECALAHPLIEEHGVQVGVPWPGGGEKGVSVQPHEVHSRVAPAGGAGPATSVVASCLQSSRMSWAEARDPHIYRPITIALLMRFLQQLTGITPILVYLQPIFNSTAVLLVRAQPPRPGSGPPVSLRGWPLLSTCSVLHSRCLCRRRPPGARP